MSDRAVSCFSLCAFMRHINAHKIYVRLCAHKIYRSGPLVYVTFMFSHKRA
jgi:hypothetical protein